MEKGLIEGSKSDLLIYIFLVVHKDLNFRLVQINTHTD